MPKCSRPYTAERTESVRLRRENRELKQADEIFRLASAIFAWNSNRGADHRRVHRRVSRGLRRRVDLPCAFGSRGQARCARSGSMQANRS